MVENNTSRIKFWAKKSLWRFLIIFMFHNPLIYLKKIWVDFDNFSFLFSPRNSNTWINIPLSFATTLALARFVTLIFF